LEQPMYQSLSSFTPAIATVLLAQVTRAGRAATGALIAIELELKLLPN
jgi:hypothetical protein